MNPVHLGWINQTGKIKHRGGVEWGLQEDTPQQTLPLLVPGDPCGDPRQATWDGLNPGAPRPHLKSLGKQTPEDNELQSAREG